MNRTEFIGKLEALYVGERNCLDELLATYDELERKINKAVEICEPFVEWGECTINGKILKQIQDVLIKGE